VIDLLYDHLSRSFKLKTSKIQLPYITLNSSVIHQTSCEIVFNILFKVYIWKSCVSVCILATGQGRSINSSLICFILGFRYKCQIPLIGRDNNCCSKLSVALFFNSSLFSDLPELWYEVSKNIPRSSTYSIATWGGFGAA